MGECQKEERRNTERSHERKPKDIAKYQGTKYSGITKP